MYTESIIYFIVVCFPLILNLFYTIYNKVVENEEKNLYEDIILVFIEYLLIISKSKYIYLLMTLPLLFSIIKNKKITSILLIQYT